MTRNDRVLLYGLTSILICMIILGVAVRLCVSKADASVVVVVRTSRVVYSLTENQIIDIGTHRIEIVNEKVRITHAQCSDTICEKAGWVGDGVIVCAPFKLAVFVTPAKKSPVDAITY